MSTTVRFLAVFLVLLTATASAARQSDDLARTVEELRGAEALLESTSDYFRALERNEPPPIHPGDRAEIFQKLRGAAEIFERLAPPMNEKALLKSLQEAFMQGMHPPPPTVVDAANEAEKTAYYNLAGRTREALARHIKNALDNVEAEIRFGPFVENPQLYDGITPPRDGIELLRNLKVVLDRDWLLRRDFYTPDNLRRVFGHPPALQRKPDGTISAQWRGMANSAALLRMESNRRNWAACTYFADFRPSGYRKHGRIGMACTFDDGLNPVPDDVERVFGRQWSNTWRPSLHGLKLPATSNYGNTNMTYTFDTASTRRWLVVSFASVGTIEFLELAEEAK